MAAVDERLARQEQACRGSLINLVTVIEASEEATMAVLVLTSHVTCTRAPRRDDVAGPRSLFWTGTYVCKCRYGKVIKGKVKRENIPVKYEKKSNSI